MATRALHTKLNESCIITIIKTLHKEMNLKFLFSVFILFFVEVNISQINQVVKPKIDN